MPNIIAWNRKGQRIPPFSSDGILWKFEQAWVFNDQNHDLSFLKKYQKKILFQDIEKPLEDWSNIKKRFYSYPFYLIWDFDFQPELHETLEEHRLHFQMQAMNTLFLWYIGKKWAEKFQLMVRRIKNEQTNHFSFQGASLAFISEVETFYVNQRFQQIERLRINYPYLSKDEILNFEIENIKLQDELYLTLPNLIHALNFLIQVLKEMNEFDILRTELELYEFILMNFQTKKEWIRCQIALFTLMKKMHFSLFNIGNWPNEKLASIIAIQNATYQWLKEEGLRHFFDNFTMRRFPQCYKATVKEWFNFFKIKPSSSIDLLS